MEHQLQQTARPTFKKHQISATSFTFLHRSRSNQIVLRWGRNNPVKYQIPYDFFLRQTRTTTTTVRSSRTHQSHLWYRLLLWWLLLASCIIGSGGGVVVQCSQPSSDERDRQRQQVCLCQLSSRYAPGRMENNGEKRTGKFLSMEITNEHQLQVIIMWSGFVQLNVNNLCGPAKGRKSCNFGGKKTRPGKGYRNQGLGESN